MIYSTEDYDQKQERILKMIQEFSRLDKSQQKSRLSTHFGMITGPLKRLADSATPVTLVELTKAIAIMDREVTDGWRGFASAFGLVDGISYGKVADDLEYLFSDSSIIGLRQSVASPAADPVALKGQLATVITNLEQRFYTLIDMIPVTMEVTLSERDMPFTFYRAVHGVISLAHKRAHLFDAYLKPTVYDLYLAELSRDLEIRLVTVHGDNKHGAVGVSAVSDVFRREFTNYKLIEVPTADLHDRNLRVDDEVYVLGASLADAGRKPTHFGPVADNVNAELDKLLNSGTVIHSS